MGPKPPWPLQLLSSQGLPTFTSFSFQTLLQPSSSNPSALPTHSLPNPVLASAPYLIKSGSGTYPTEQPSFSKHTYLFDCLAQHCPGFPVSWRLLLPYPPPSTTPKLLLALVQPSPSRFSTCPAFIPLGNLNCHALLWFSPRRLISACLLDISDPAKPKPIIVSGPFPHTCFTIS